MLRYTRYTHSQSLQLFAVVYTFDRFVVVVVVVVVWLPNYFILSLLKQGGTRGTKV